MIENHEREIEEIKKKNKNEVMNEFINTHLLVSLEETKKASKKNLEL